MVYRGLKVVDKGIDAVYLILNCTSFYNTVKMKKGTDFANEFFKSGAYTYDYIVNKRENYFLYDFLQETDNLKYLLESASGDAVFIVSYFN